MNASKKIEKKKKAVRVIIIVLIVLLALTAAVMMLRRRVTAKFGAEAFGSVESSKVTVGSISTTVSGSGSLADEDVEDIELPSSVEFEDIAVSAGDKVQEGDLLATVDMTTVFSAMNKLQNQIDDYDNQIGDAVSDAGSTSITTPVSGRVKAIYGEYGDDVSRVMYDHGALAVISIDGKMAVDITADSLETGDAVYVTRADGTVLDGEVADIDGENAVVTVTDDGPVLGEKVNVSSSAGAALGEGELYVHKALNVTGFAGTVSSCYYKENDSVNAGVVLMYLTDTAYSANYDALLKERDEMEEQLRDLVAVYKEGALYAHMSGSVSSVTAATGDAAAATGTQTVMSICPDKTMTVTLSVDETDILSLSLGQEAEITVSSVGDETFTGTVTKLETAGTSSSGVTCYTAVITLDKAEKMLSGMTAKVIIRIEGVDDALIIPSDALHQTSDKSYVYTGYDADTGIFTGMTEVIAGMNNGTSVEILSGLNEGDTVCYEPSGDGMFSFGGMHGMGGVPDMGGMPQGGFDGGNMPRGGMPGRG